MNIEIVHALQAIVGRRFVSTGVNGTRAYRRGYRGSEGDCLAVVRPGTLLQFWHVLQACVQADTIILIQAANTGLTGGSTPNGPYDRRVIIISTLRLNQIRLIKGGEQIVCQAGATLNQLEKRLAPIRREPHSVIGSSCIGASIVGGICNNSGGALIARGPAYTEMALYAQLGSDRELRLINHLGLALGTYPEMILRKLDEAADLDSLITCEGKGSDDRYASDVRQVNAGSPARFNADPRRLFEASGSAGKVAVFAVRLDSFPRERGARTFYIGTNDPAALTALRQAMLQGAGALPISAEYLHAEAFDLADCYGKDLFLAIRTLGAERLPLLAKAQRRFDALMAGLPGRPRHVSERILQGLSRLWPDHLPGRLRKMRAQYAHHLLLKVTADGIDPTWSALHATIGADDGAYFLCSAREEADAFRHRFVTAGAAVRYANVHSGAASEVLALDIALRRNERDWFEKLPSDLEAEIIHRAYYGHFFCHVLHQDYVLRKGANGSAIKQRMLALLDARGAEYPAEHNVGHAYRAKPALEAHYRALDPCNVFNPGVGKLGKAPCWREYGET